MLLVIIKQNYMSILGNLKTSQVFFCQLINHFFFLNQKSDDESRLFRVCDEASFRALSLVRTVWTALHKCSEKSNEYSATNSAPPAQLTQMSFWKALEKQSGTSSLLTAELKFLKTTEKRPPLLPSLALKVSPPTKIITQRIELLSDLPLMQGLFSSVWICTGMLKPWAAP